MSVDPVEEEMARMTMDAVIIALVVEVHLDIIIVVVIALEEQIEMVIERVEIIVMIEVVEEEEEVKVEMRVETVVVVEEKRLPQGVMKIERALQDVEIMIQDQEEVVEIVMIQDQEEIAEIVVIMIERQEVIQMKILKKGMMERVEMMMTINVLVKIMKTKSLVSIQSAVRM